METHQRSPSLSVMPISFPLGHRDKRLCLAGSINSYLNSIHSSIRGLGVTLTIIGWRYGAMHGTWSASIFLVGSLHHTFSFTASTVVADSRVIPSATIKNRSPSALTTVRPTNSSPRGVSSIGHRERRASVRGPFYCSGAIEPSVAD